MKILYVSSPHFFDLDLSFVKALSDKCDLYYLLDVSPNTRNYTALELARHDLKAGIYPINQFPELGRWNKWLDQEKSFVLYRTSNKSYDWSNIRLQFSLSAFVSKLSPDVIHASGFLNIRHLFFLLRNKWKTLLTVHDAFPHSGENSAKVRRKRALNYFFIKNVLLLNRTQKDDFVNDGHADKRVFVSSLGTYDYLQTYKKNVPRDETFRILFFGRVSKYKGLEYLLPAFEMMLNKGYVNCELLIAGSGTFWFDIERYRKLAQVKIINRFIPNTELVELLQNTSVVVCPYTDATQSGVIMTAFAIGRTVVATNVGGLPEMVEHNYTGLLVTPKSSEELFNALNFLESNRQLIKQFEKNIEDSYFTGEKSWNAITDKILEIYKSL